MTLIKGYIKVYEPRCEKTGLRGFRPGPTQTGLKARGLKFRIYEVEGLYYPCSENKGAEADLRLCFRICKNPVLS